MKLNPDDSSIVDLGVLLDAGNFESTLPSEDVWKAAYADPAASALLSGDELGRSLVETGVRAFRFTGARVAVGVGVPHDAISFVEQSLSIRGADQAIVDWAKFAIGEAQDAIIDAAVQAMGAIPIVGWIAKVAAAVMRLVMQAAEKQEPPPSIVEYSKGKDVDLARHTLTRLAASDWTHLFMPAYEVTRALDWTTTELSGGYLLRPEHDSAGLGAIPGGPFGSRGVQSRNCWSPSFKSVETIGFGRQEALDWNARQVTSVAKHGAKCILDLWQTTPSVARVAVAAWQQMTAKKTAALWNVDTGPIVPAWEAYVGTALEYSKMVESNPGGFGNPNQQKWVWLAAINLRIAMYVRGWQIGGDSPTRAVRLDVEAARCIRDLRRRQYAAARTVLAAYADFEQGAFRSRPLRMAVERERQALLSGDIRWWIKPEDVVDVEFRKALEESKRGLSGPPRVPPDDRGSTNEIPGAEGLPLPTGDGAGGAALALGLLLAAGALLL